MKTNVLLIISFLLISGNLLAQKEFLKGYVITNSADTLNGYIANNAYHKNALVCEFKEDSLSAVQKFEPADIYAYKFNQGKFYISKQVRINNQKQYLFLEFLINGELDVYYLRIKGSDFYFAQKEGDTIYHLENNNIYYDYDLQKRKWVASDHETIQKVRQSNRYKGILNILLKEAPEIQKDAASAKLTHKSLINLAKDYHYAVCDDEDCTVYEKPIKSKSWLGVTGGYSFINYVNTDVRTVQSFAINRMNYPGIYFSTQLISVSEYMNFNTEVYFTAINATVEKGNYSNEINGLALDMPITVGYDFASWKIKPYVEAGLVIHHLLNAEIITSKTQNGFVDVKVNDHDTQAYENPLLGATASGGLKYSIRRFLVNVGVDYSIYFAENFDALRTKVGIAYLFGPEN